MLLHRAERLGFGVSSGLPISRRHNGQEVRPLISPFAGDERRVFHRTSFCATLASLLFQWNEMCIICGSSLNTQMCEGVDVVSKMSLRYGEIH